FAAEADEPSVGTLKTAVTARDGKVYNDDCLEFMVDPTGQRVEYYHFVVNPLGTIYDAQGRQGGAVESADWNCNVLAAAKTGTDKWTVELRVPVVELGMTAASRGDWAVEVARERQAKGSELSSFAPLTGGFHQPGQYAVLKLPGADFDPYLWDITAPQNAQVYPNAAGTLMYRAAVTVANHGSRERRFRLRGVLGETAGSWARGRLRSGESSLVKLEVPVKEARRQTLRLQLVDGRDTTMILALRNLQVDATYAPLTVDLIRPRYRENVYATEDLHELIFDVTAAVPEEELGKLQMACALLRGAPEQGPMDERVMAKAEQPARHQSRVTLPVTWPAQDPDGRYTLVVILADAKDHKIRHRSVTVIRKLPKVADEWRFDEHKVLLHNGEPVLPFGWFSMPVEKMAEPGHAYQLMQNYGYTGVSPEKVREFLDKVAAAKTAVTIYPYPQSSMMAAATWGKPLSDSEAEALARHVGALRTHPGLFAWYMADEPELRPAIPERTRRIYEVIESVDPYHPCIMLNDTLEGIRKYWEGGDVLMPDPYPCFLKGGLAAQPIQKVSEFVKTCGEVSGGRKAIWVTPQAFNYGDYGRVNQRAPRLIELRNMLYQAAIYGAKGFLWFTYAHTANYPDLGIGMPWLSFEVADLKSAILADPSTEVSLKADAPQPWNLHLSVRRVGKELYVFAVNTATIPQQVRLTFTSGPGPQELYVVSEGRKVKLQRGVSWTDRFETYDTHVYTTDEKVGTRENLAVPLAAIAKAEAALQKPGNLAFEGKGTKVAVSSRAQFGSAPDRLVDGVTEGMRWVDGTPGQLPDWFTVTWPQPVKIGRVTLYSSAVAQYEVQVPTKEGWQTVGKGSASTGSVIEAAVAAQVQASQMRILITALRPDQDYTAVQEVEVWEK
ncbi:MAG: hypothetical protein ABFE16_20925, partial [Armatimonadia bacterium]